MFLQIASSILTSPTTLSVSGCLCLTFILYYGHYLLPEYVVDLPGALRFLFRGRDMIREGMKLHGEKPFSVPMPGTRIHIFTSKQHFMELNKSHTRDLSLHAAIIQILSPPHSLGGFQLPDRRDIEGMNFVRALRSVNVRIKHYVPKILRIAKEDFDRAFANGVKNDGYVEVPLYSHMRNLILRTNTLFQLSEELASNMEFHELAMGYCHRALLTAEICRSVPSWCKGLVSYLVQGNQRHRKQVFAEIGKYAQRYIAEGEANDGKIELNGRNASVLEFLTRCYPPHWNLTRLVQEVATAWMPSITLLGSVGTNVIMDIFVHPEHIPALRAEIAEHWTDPETIDTDKLEFLESFMAESARMHSYESTNIHRVARHEFTFSDGYTVPKGHWAEFGQQSVFENPNLYPEPMKFDPYRHLKAGRKFKDVSMEWPMWGAPRLACPGRIMVDRFIKIVVAHMLMEYDVKLSQTTKLNFTWRESEVPNPNVKLLLRKREKHSD